MAEHGRFADRILHDRSGSFSNQADERRGGPSEVSDQDVVLVGLIDSVRFSRDCLIQALRIQSPELSMLPFGSVQECIEAERSDLRMILYYSHQESSSQPAVLQRVRPALESLIV